VVLTVHDAVACIAPKQEAEEAMAYVMECMRFVPSWAEGIPLNCEAGVGESYETVKRNYGKISKGHRIPYGTMVGVDPEIRLAYYSHGYKEDSMLPEIPCPPVDAEYVDPEEELFKKEMVGVVQEALETLTPRAIKVLCLRFGIGLDCDYTLEEVGRTFEVTRERIRQIEVKALRDLKHPQRSEKLRQLLGYYQTTADKEAKEKKLQRQWARAREAALERDRELEQFKATLAWKEKATRREIERAYEEDLRLRAKWDEIEPMVSDTDWVKHLKAEQPEMYQELKDLVQHIWGKNAVEIWNMYAKKK
jgi:RNA polymerase sigma factor (sigma-70 family)